MKGSFEASRVQAKKNIRTKSWYNEAGVRVMLFSESVGMRVLRDGGVLLCFQ